MKPIKVIPENAPQIDALLKAVNGDACAHTFHRAQDILDILARADGTLATLLPKRYFSGARWSTTSGRDVAKSYKYKRQATRVVLERRASGWYLIEVASVTLWEKGGSETLLLTPDQDELAVKRFRTRYTVIPAPVPPIPPIDALVRKHTVFSSVSAMADAPGGTYTPSLRVSESDEIRQVADAYDKAMELRGDARRAVRS